MQTFGLTLMLQDDPQKIATYKEMHLKVWPEVTARLREVGVHEMRIFLRGLRMFMYIETVDDFDPRRDMARVNDDPKSAEWNALMADGSFQQLVRRLIGDAVVGGGCLFGAVELEEDDALHHAQLKGL